MTQHNQPSQPAFNHLNLTPFTTINGLAPLDSNLLAPSNHLPQCADDAACPVATLAVASPNQPDSLAPASHLPLNNHVSPDSLTPLHDLPSTSHVTSDQSNFTHVSYQPINWLWHHRIPLAGITLLDGDHGCAKSLLSLHIAASGSSMPDGSPSRAMSSLSPPTPTQTPLSSNYSPPWGPISNTSTSSPSSPTLRSHPPKTLTHPSHFIPPQN